MAPKPKRHLSYKKKHTEKEHDVKTQTHEERRLLCKGRARDPSYAPNMEHFGPPDTGRHKEGFSPRELEGAWPC